jgi:hypothetical protein
MWWHLVGGRRLLFIVGRVPVLLDRMGSERGWLCYRITVFMGLLLRLAAGQSPSQWRARAR